MNMNIFFNSEKYYPDQLFFATDKAWVEMWIVL